MYTCSFSRISSGLTVLYHIAHALSMVFFLFAKIIFLQLTYVNSLSHVYLRVFFPCGLYFSIQMSIQQRLPGTTNVISAISAPLYKRSPSHGKQKKQTMVRYHGLPYVFAENENCVSCRSTIRRYFKLLPGFGPGTSSLPRTRSTN